MRLLVLAIAESRESQYAGTIPYRLIRVMFCGQLPNECLGLLFLESFHLPEDLMLTGRLMDAVGAWHPFAGQDILNGFCCSASSTLVY